MTIFRNLLLIIGLCLFRTSFGEQPDDGIAEAARLIQQQAGAHRLILIGELHGTREVPRLIAKLVSEYSAKEPVVLGLEVHNSEQQALQRYLTSDGGPAAIAALQSGPFWQVHGVQHDGRRNYELFDLIEQLRRLKTKGCDVDILPFDDLPTQMTDSEHRDKAMAGRLRAAFVHMHRGRLLALSGNVHALLQRPGYAPAEMQTPMGSYLHDLEPFSVDVTARGGEFWACMKECRPVAVTSSQTSRTIDDGTYNLQIVLPRLTVAHLIGAEEK